MRKARSEMGADIMEHIDIKKEVVLALLNMIKVDKTPFGPDGMYPRLLREARGDFLGPPPKHRLSQRGLGE